MSEPATMLDDTALATARELVTEMESGNETRVAQLLDELSRQREQGLFRELGKLTRELHEALSNFHIDARLASLTESDIPDAKARLNHVISMTEEAANKTLSAVEDSLPIAEELQQGARELHDKWQRFRRRDMIAEEFRSLIPEIDRFLDMTSSHADALSTNLSAVLMAQGFQDLTGQIIRQVITLVQEVEEKLVGLIRISGQQVNKDGTGLEQKDEASRGFGPQVPGLEQGEVMNDQDDVDELLSSLGF
ncbi:protein phosphatase CheZ [Thiohalobacter sp. IOR34]|uniref:protein phosphatase CheZ n=1 Tax=Thiohalobacter sp. IOR34 TaxID=3057176 RepID=UPI0025AFB967|nr:protein phosphatase CheZ [Thiohalobacter sp. IOR34]WJW74557.1 protein phosphatase CheZ [Thiohalobacter sp. IOR34]